MCCNLMRCKTAVRSLIYALLVLILAGIASSQSDPLAPYVFNPVTIVAGGYVPDLIAHPTQPGLYYLRTDIGGVYRWNQATSRWIQLLDANGSATYNLTGPESIALDPTDPNKLYIAAGMYTSGPFGFWVSNDQGNTFSAYPETNFQMAANNDGRSAGERLAVNPFKTNELFMATRSSGLWVSENNAQTWTKSASFPVQSSTDGFGLHFVVFDPVNSGTVYVGSYSTSRVYVSKDDGATWTALPAVAWPFTVPSGTHAAAPERAVLNPDGNLYVNFDNLPGPNNMNYGVVEKYNPQTNAWTNITPPYDGVFQTGPAGGFAGMSQDPNRAGTVAVSTLDRWYPVDTVYITRDGGGTWTDLGYVSSENGIDGPPYGNYYFNPSVYALSPYLTFGDTSYPTSPYPSSKFGWWLSGLMIDPTNPDHVLYGTGATVYATDNVSAAYSGNAPTWYVQGLGVEETAVLALISPTAGAHLISGVGDIGGFRHDDFSVSPSGGMFTNPVATTVGSLDFAGQSPSVIVRSQAPSSASTSPCTYGAYSNDGGTTWSPFPKCATGGNSSNGGVLAVDASGTMFMWGPASGNSNRPQYSTNNGTSWTATTGLSSRVNAYADKVTPQLFYAFISGNSGGFYSTTTSAGKVFTKVSTSPATFTNGSCNGSGCGVVRVNWAQAGDIWLPLGTNGLYHSTNGGVTWTKLGVTEADSVSVGATVPGTGTQSVFLYGIVSSGGFRGIYRSDNSGASWFQVNDTAHQYGGQTLITADPRSYGRVYLGMNGRGIIYIDPGAVLTVQNASGPYGGTATLTASLISGSNPLAGRTVTFSLNGSTVGSATTDGIGNAAVTANLGTIPPGTYPSAVGASFAGDTVYAPTTGTGSLTVTAGSGTVVVSASATLVKNADSSYTATVVVKNTGTGWAMNVVMNTATLGAASGTPLPQTLGNIAPGGSVTTTVNYPASAGASHSAVVEKYAGTYTGSGWTTSIRATLP